MQAVAAVQLKAQEPRAVVRAGGFGIITGVAALEPDIVQHQRLAAERAAHLIQRRVIFVGIVVQAVKVGLDIVRFGIGIVQQGGCQLGGGVRVFGNALGQRQAAADFCGVQGIVQRIVEIAVMLNAKAVHHAFQRQALAFPAGEIFQKDLLQVIPAGGPAFVHIIKEQVLLQHRHIVQTPLGKFGIGAGPFLEPPQAFGNGHPGFQITLAQASHLRNAPMQLAENAGAQGHLKGIQYIAILVHPHCTDLDDLTPQGQLRPMIIKGFGRIAHVPFQVKNDQVHCGSSKMNFSTASPTPSCSLSAVTYLAACFTSGTALPMATPMPA